MIINREFSKKKVLKPCLIYFINLVQWKKIDMQFLDVYRFFYFFILYICYHWHYYDIFNTRQKYLIWYLIMHNTIQYDYYYCFSIKQDKRSDPLQLLPTDKIHNTLHILHITITLHYLHIQGALVIYFI